MPVQAIKSTARQARDSFRRWPLTHLSAILTTCATLVGLFFLLSSDNTAGPATASEQKTNNTQNNSSDVQKQTSQSQLASASNSTSPTTDTRQKIVGEWKYAQDEDRCLTIRENGTAKMTVDIDGAWSYVIGNRIEVNIDWTLQNEELVFRATGGKPQSKIKLVTDLWGDSRCYSVLECNQKQIVLRDQDSESKEKWKRVPSS